MQTQTPPENLTPGAVEEIDRYRQDVQEMKDEIGRLRQGAVSEDDFKKFRLQRGIYGQRQKPDIQMIRIKVPWGRLTADQIEVLADVADDFPGADRKGIAHVTTRQAIQLHFVPLERVSDCMERLRRVGLTTREACSNTVRNVTADPLAGVAADEAFDVSPYAEAVVRYFLRHPVCQNLPRKFKITFSGSAADRGLIPMHDIGCLAQVRNPGGREERGFKLYAGGGLGPTPKTAQLIEDFTPQDQLLRTVHAALFVFNRDWDYGRTNRNMARLKFLVEKIGMEEFRRRLFQERENLKGEPYPDVRIFEDRPPEPRVPLLPEAWSPEYQRWKSTNVLAQKQAGYSTAVLRLPLGDIRSQQLRALSDIVRKFGDGTARTWSEQNLVARWIRNDALYTAYLALAQAGLAAPSAGRLADITSCPGADTCQLGITSSRGLATAIGKIFQNGRGQDADLKDIRIKISGCPNSCGQHHVADIGFYGGAKSLNGRQLPTYTMLLGGHIGPDGAAFGKHFLRVPAKKVPGVVERLLDVYKASRQGDEKFREFVARVGLETLKKELEPLAGIAESAEADFSDWGESGDFQIAVGKGECAA